MTQSRIWRNYFVECKTRRLQEFSLRELETPISRSACLNLVILDFLKLVLLLPVITDPQIWSAYFAVWETELLRRHPLPNSLLPLEQAQYELARNYFHHAFPLEELHEAKAMYASHHSNKPIVFEADTPTRKAFFEHFSGERSLNIFCCRREDGDNLRNGRTNSYNELPYSKHHHQFINCSLPHSSYLERVLDKKLIPDDISLSDLFVCHSGSYRGPLSAVGEESLWHWNGENLVHLPQYDSSWIS